MLLIYIIIVDSYLDVMPDVGKILSKYTHVATIVLRKTSIFASKKKNFTTFSSEARVHRVPRTLTRVISAALVRTFVGFLTF